jgi:hypothetical protein
MSAPSTFAALAYVDPRAVAEELGFYLYEHPIDDGDFRYRFQCSGSKLGTPGVAITGNRCRLVDGSERPDGGTLCDVPFDRLRNVLVTEMDLAAPIADLDASTPSSRQKGNDLLDSIKVVADTAYHCATDREAPGFGTGRHKPWSLWEMAITSSKTTGLSLRSSSRS